MDGKVITNADIAKVCHETNRAFCQTLGDTSQPAWEDAPQWQRDSAIKGVDFNLNNPFAPASASHDSWSKQKVEEGWVYGEIKDPVAKTHPCLVPFDKLPLDQQIKDVLFKSVVKAMAPLLSTTAPLTIGEYRVGISFNPGGHPAVNEIKRRAADLIDLLEFYRPKEDLAFPNGPGEVNRLFSLSQTDIETAAMHGVKAVTKPAR